jgi:hypothetical protein
VPGANASAQVSMAMTAAGRQRNGTGNAISS